MLDKSVPYVDVLMHRKAGAPLPIYDVPPGFRAVWFRPGDEKDWARLETSVLEFPNEMEALLYFQARFIAFFAELALRCVFLETEAGERVATAMAWWEYSGLRRDPWLHWVSVSPAYQGKGLGKAVVSAALCRMRAIEGDRDFYLHTQTWSHKAIGIYKLLGFEITEDKTLRDYKNEGYAQAIKILEDIERKQTIALQDEE